MTIAPPAPGTRRHADEPHIHEDPDPTRVMGNGSAGTRSAGTRTGNTLEERIARGEVGNAIRNTLQDEVTDFRRLLNQMNSAQSEEEKEAYAAQANKHIVHIFATARVSKEHMTSTQYSEVNGMLRSINSEYAATIKNVGMELDSVDISPFIHQSVKEPMKKAFSTALAEEIQGDYVAEAARMRVLLFNMHESIVAAVHTAIQMTGADEVGLSELFGRILATFKEREGFSPVNARIGSDVDDGPSIITIANWNPVGPHSNWPRDTTAEAAPFVGGPDKLREMAARLFADLSPGSTIKGLQILDKAYAAETKELREKIEGLEKELKAAEKDSTALPAKEKAKKYEELAEAQVEMYERAAKMHAEQVRNGSETVYFPKDKTYSKAAKKYKEEAEKNLGESIKNYTGLKDYLEHMAKPSEEGAKQENQPKIDASVTDAKANIDRLTSRLEEIKARPTLEA